MAADVDERGRPSVAGALGVLDVARGVLADLDLDVVLERVIEAAQDLTGAQYAALGVLDCSRSGLDRFITVGIDDPTHQSIGALPRGRGVLGELISDPRPLRLVDVEAHPHSYGFPPGHPAMASFLGVPVLVAGEPFGNLYLTEKSGGGEFTEDDEQAVVRLADLAGVAIDHAQRYGDIEAQRSELTRTVEALDATVQISRAVGGETNLDAVLQLVAKRGRALVSARTLVIEQQQGAKIVVTAGAGELPSGLVGRTVDLDESVASAALRSLGTLRLEDEPNLARFDRHGVGRLGVRAGAGLVVPLVFHGRGYGVLIAVDRLDDGPAFTADDQRLLGGIRGERGDGRRDRRVRRGRPAEAEACRGRAGTGAVGSRTARRNPSEPRLGATRPGRPAETARARDVRSRRSATRSDSWRSRSAIFAR